MSKLIDKLLGREKVANKKPYERMQLFRCRTLSEVAALLNVTTVDVKRLVEAGHLKAFQYENETLFDEREIKKFLKDWPNFPLK